MMHGCVRKARVASVAMAALGFSVLAWSQGTPTTAKASAPINLIGYWVAVINTDWQWRMVTPAKGDHNMVPITPAAQKILDSWDPAKDEAAGEQCRAYGAPGLMRLPIRLHITWQDDNSIKLDADAGQQTRLLHFTATQVPVSPQPSWQGESAARWDMATGTKADDGPRYGSLHVVTTHLRPGYLRRNGLPYSADTVLTEDWDLMNEPNGNEWLVVMSTVADPLYLQMPWMTSLVFKREPDASKWDPSPCSAR